jgi:hypothetical protein
MMPRPTSKDVIPEAVDKWLERWTEEEAVYFDREDLISVLRNLLCWEWRDTTKVMVDLAQGYSWEVDDHLYDNMDGIWIIIDDLLASYIKKWIYHEKIRPRFSPGSIVYWKANTRENTTEWTVMDVDYNMAQYKVQCQEKIDSGSNAFYVVDCERIDDDPENKDRSTPPPGEE